MSFRESTNQEGSRTIIRRIVERGVRPVNDDPNGQNSLTTHQVIRNIARQHENEQRELQELNNKFAVYLDRVHYLEDKNKQLNNQLERVRQTWGTDTSQVLSILDPKLRDLRRTVDDAIRDQALQELRWKRYEYDVWQIQQQIASLNPDQDREKLLFVQSQLDQSTTELDQVKLQFDQRLGDLARQRDTMESLLGELGNLKNELDSRQLERILLESEIQTMKEHASFQDAVYQAQRAEFQALDTPTIDVSGFYRNELARAISEIRHDFEILSDSRANELEEYYRVKTEEVRSKIAEEDDRRRLSAQQNALELTEHTMLADSIKQSSDELQSLKDQNRNLQTLIDSLFLDLQAIQNARENQILSFDKDLAQLENEVEQKRSSIGAVLENNVSLRFEISTYRNLLDVEENHLKRSENQVQRPALTDYSFSNIVSTSPARPVESGTKKMTVSKTSRGPISVDSVDLETDSVVLTNDKFSGNSQSFENWTLRRKIDQQDELVYSFPATFSLRPRETVRIVSKKSPMTSRLLNNVLLAEQIDTWGQGQRMVTRLVDNNNEEKAILTQTFQ